MYRLFGKRLLDVSFSLIGIIICLPFFIFVAILQKINSEDSVFFLQKRIGQNGKLFYLIKFRTMVSDLKNEELMFELGKNGRVTKIGKFLRLTKIDELPQLFNVIIGDMSFVGYRPDVIKYSGFYEGNNRQILNIRPGITDLASIKYRNEEKLLAQSNQPDQLYEKVILPDKLRLNLEYIRRGITLKKDVVIIARTLVQCLFGSQAVIMSWKKRVIS